MSTRKRPSRSRAAVLFDLGERVQEASAGESPAQARFLLGLFIRRVQEGGPIEPQLLQYFAKAFAKYLELPSIDLEKALGLKRPRAGNPNATAAGRVEQAKHLMETHPGKDDATVESDLWKLDPQLTPEMVHRAVEVARGELLADRAARAWAFFYAKGRADGLRGAQLEAFAADKVAERLATLKRKRKVRARQRR